MARSIVFNYPSKIWRHVDRQVACAVCLVGLFLGQSACTAVPAPRRLPPTNSILLSTGDIPVVLLRGDTGYFSAKTDPQNTCLAGIGYRDQINNWIWVDLPEIKPDATTGACQWDWEVPTAAAAGVAEFRVSAQQQGNSRMLAPMHFCIEKCPYSYTPEPIHVSNP